MTYKKATSLASFLITLVAAVTLAAFDASGDSRKVGLDFADALGPAPMVAQGSHLLAAGVGLADAQPGKIEFTLPSDAVVKQVLLYWEGWYSPKPEYFPYNTADDAITITPDGSTVNGVKIGGETVLPFTDNRPVTFRANITALGLVQPGSNHFSLDGLRFNNRNDGAGLIVIYDRKNSLSGKVEIRDGSDFALEELTGDFNRTEPQRFEFEARPYAREVQLALFVSSVDGGLQNYLQAVVGAENGTQSQTIYANRFANRDGNRWDTLVLPLTLPANSNSITVQLFSGPGNCPTPDPLSSPEICSEKPSSFVWNMVALSIPDYDTPPVCEVSGATTQCTGAETVINMDARNSYDPEGKLLHYTWSTDCADAVLDALDTRVNPLILRLPWTGAAQSCSVTLKVNDGKYESACAADVKVSGCYFDCLGQLNGNAKIDQCNVCNGKNECLDCKGTPHGGAKTDLCGVCEGDNSSCSDCTGTPNGNTKVDKCGVCGGDNLKCADCLGVPNGSARFDRCGVCNGSDECEQCAESSAVNEINTMFERSARQREDTLRLIKEMLTV